MLTVGFSVQPQLGFQFVAQPIDGINAVVFAGAFGGALGILRVIGQCFADRFQFWQVDTVQFFALWFDDVHQR